MVGPNWTCWLLSLLIGPFDSSVLILVLLMYSMRSLKIVGSNTECYILVGFIRYLWTLKRKVPASPILNPSHNLLGEVLEEFFSLLLRNEKVGAESNQRVWHITNESRHPPYSLRRQEKTAFNPFSLSLAHAHTRTHASARTPCVHICTRARRHTHMHFLLQKKRQWRRGNFFFPKTPFYLRVLSHPLSLTHTHTHTHTLLR